MKYLLAIIIFTAVFSVPGNIPEGTAQPVEVVQEFNTPVEAPEFVLKEISGKEMSLKEHRGKIVLLNFFTTW